MENIRQVDPGTVPSTFLNSNGAVQFCTVAEMEPKLSLQRRYLGEPFVG